MQAQKLVAYAHPARIEADVLTDDRLLFIRQREVAGQQTCVLLRADDFVRREAFESQQPGVIQNAFHLPYGIHEAGDGIRIPHLLRDDDAPAQGREIALAAQLLPGRHRDEQAARMFQVRPLVEMPLERARKKTLLPPVVGGHIALLDEAVLLVHDGMRRQHFQGFEPCRMDRLVLGARHGEQLGQRNAECRRDVGILRQDAVLLDGQKRKLRFQRGCSQGSSHDITVLR